MGFPPPPLPPGTCFLIAAGSIASEHTGKTLRHLPGLSIKTDHLYEGVGFPVAKQFTETFSSSFMLDISGSIVTIGFAVKKQNKYERLRKKNTKWS